MGDLSSVELLFEDFLLEKLDISNEKHISVLSKFRDKAAIDMCYDVFSDVESNREGLSDENLYLVKNNDNYFGYLCITNSIDGNRELAYIIQEDVRKGGLGTILLTSVSDFLLNEDINTSNLFLQVKHNNVGGIKLATKCGFAEVIPSRYDDYDTYQKKLKNKG